MLYRTNTGEVLVKRDQYYIDKGGNVVYTDFNGIPVDQEGKPIEGSKVDKFVYTFEEYVKLYPQGEDYRNWFTVRRMKGSITLIFQTYPNWSCMPGCMYNVYYTPRFIHPKNEKYNMKPRVAVNDGDDFTICKFFETEEEALAGLEELKSLAPFEMAELTDFGYKYD